MGRKSSGCSNRVTPSVYCKYFGPGGKSRKRSKRRSGKKRSSRRSKTRKCGCPIRGGSKGRKRKGKRCHRPGPTTRNPFLNFLRVFRVKHCNWPITKVAVEGAKAWCEMSKEQKMRFYKQACAMQKKGKGKLRHGKLGKRLGRGRRRHKGRGRSKRGKKFFNIC